MFSDRGSLSALLVAYGGKISGEEYRSRVLAMSAAAHR